MAVRVLITREFKPDKLNEAHQLLKELRSVVTLRPGYISGQTLISADNPNKVVVVSTWTSHKRWEDWKADPKRKEFSKRVESLVESPEKVEVFLAGVPSED